MLIDLSALDSLRQNRESHYVIIDLQYKRKCCSVLWSIYTRESTNSRNLIASELLTKHSA